MSGTVTKASLRWNNCLLLHPKEGTKYDTAFLNLLRLGSSDMFSGAC